MAGFDKGECSGWLISGGIQVACWRIRGHHRFARLAMPGFVWDCVRQTPSVGQMLSQHRAPKFFDQPRMPRFVDEIAQLTGIIG